MEALLVDEIVKRVMQELYKQRSIPVEASGRHVHLSQLHSEQLFGRGYQFTRKKDLSQPGQFQCAERVTLIGSKGIMQGVAVLGPEREKTQVEISKTDARVLGVKPPIRESGNLNEADDIYIATEKAVVHAKEAVIISKRHIHMTPDDAERFKVKDKQLVSVRVRGERSVVFEDVLIRVSTKYRLSMHIDFDEANAVGFSPDTVGEIIIKNA